MSMVPLELLIHRIGSFKDFSAIIWRDQEYSYGWLIATMERWSEWLCKNGVKHGTVTFLEADYGPTTVAMLLALWRQQIIVVPYAQTNAVQCEEFKRISQAEMIISIQNELPSINLTDSRADHSLYEQLRQTGHAGLVLFSSGTSSPSKGIVHDVDRLLAKVGRIEPRHQRILAFLIFDHLGGIDTLIYTLSNAGCLVVPEERSVDGILKTIEKHNVQLLPTSPSFLNLLLLSDAYERYSLRSLEKISYGAEPMPLRVLQRFHEVYPHIKMTQSYALSELGALRSSSESSESLWMHVGGGDVETRVIDGVLQVRSPYMMLGYLNAPSGLTEDGWFVTGDLVELRDSYVHVKGRVSDIINVGGEKVNPVEVEDVILELGEVADALVYGEANAILGQIVCALVVPRKVDAQSSLANLIRIHCLKRLPKYKVPVRIEISTGPLGGDRHKRPRRPANPKI